MKTELGSTENPSEWEMGHNQRSLVDNIVEEGQYEAAIDMLFQLRSLQYKPSISHVRQLIFLALHPVEKPNVQASAKQRNGPLKKAKSSKVSSSITQKAIVSALYLLTSLISTNSPEALGRALPSYASQDSLHPAPAEEPTDSVLAKQALCIKSSKHCWELLEDAFVFRTQIITSPKGKSKLRRDYSIEEALLDESPSGRSTIVGDSAWPVLDWLVSLFERDEDIKEQREQLRYSALFLEQLPPPRGGSVTRWDFSVVLNIVICCLEECDLRRQRIGYRLMALLINLTNTIYVELPTLVSSAYKLLLAASRTDLIESFLLNLQPALTIQRFKVFFCLKLLTDATSPIGDALQGANIRPRPQARAAPKARQAGASDAPKCAPPDAVQSNSIASKQLLPSSTEIIRCLESSLPKDLQEPINKSLVLRSKFELILSFVAVQPLDSPENRLAWDRLIQQGNLTNTLNIAFGAEPRDEALLYSQMLRESLRLAL